MIIKYNNIIPDKPFYISENATLIGDVRFGDNVSIWFGSVLRGDINYITVGNFSNIQDNSVLHVANEFPVIIGDYVTVGHNAIIHGCTIEDFCLIGMGAIILDGASIEKGSIIAAGAVVKENAIIPENSLVVGIPGVVKRILPNNIIDTLKESAEHYVEIAKTYR